VVGPHRTDRRRQHQWVFPPPYPAEGEFEFRMEFLGHPEFQWRVSLHVGQKLQDDGPGRWITRARWREHGLLDIDGWSQARVVVPIASNVVAARPSAAGLEARPF
jgi:hypothetical protein